MTIQELIDQLEPFSELEVEVMGYDREGLFPISEIELVQPHDLRYMRDDYKPSKAFITIH